MTKKLLRQIMMASKLMFYGFIIQMFSISMLLAYDGKAQEIKSVKEYFLDIEFNNQNLVQIFNTIEIKTGYRFAYDRRKIDEKITFTRRYPDNTSLSDVLLDLSEHAGISFKQINKNIIVQKIERNNQDVERLEIVIQTRTVTGTVTSQEDRMGIPGVNVIERGTNNGTITDVEGNYSITVADNAVLVFSSVGYQPREIEVGQRSVVDLLMVHDIHQLEEIVVVGYGTMQRQHLTGAVGSVTMDGDLEYKPTVEFGQMLYGQVAGVQVLNTSGRPGVSSSIQVRGINSISAGASPLIVIDGVALPDYDLSSINAADIESIHILKDAASAAIYGSRAGNGVILVTTKSGKPGKAMLTVNHSSSVQQVIRRIDVMNSAEYAQAHIDAAQNGWIDAGGDPNAPNTVEARGQLKYTWPEVFNNPETLFDTDWHSIVFRTAPMHKTDLRLSGGDENTTYMISGGVLNQTGVLINTDYQKYSLNLKADSRINNWLKFGALVNSSLDYENRAGNTTVHTLTSANQYPSIYPIRGYDGHLGGPHNTAGLEAYENILFRAHHGHPWHRGGGRELFDVNQINLLGNIYGELTLLPGLNLRSSFNAFLRRNHQKHYINADTDIGVLRRASTNVQQGQTLSYTALNYMSYTRNIERHHFDAIAGYEFTQREFYGTTTERRDYDNDLVPYLTAGRTIQSANDNAYQSALISGFFRLNYNFDNRYMASFSFRRDGSSRFGPANKWGNFPAVSAGWRISEEAFMDNASFLSNLNLRASYGFTGNESIGNYAWISSMSQGRMALGNNVFISYYPSSVQNPDLRWERTQQRNIGIDIGILGDRVALESDFYHSISDDLLLNVPIPSTSGFTSMLRNIGAMQNRGIELKLTSNNLTGALSWRTTVTYSANRNKVTRLGPGDAPMVSEPASLVGMINTVGHTIFSFYGLIYDGVYLNQAELEADPAAYESARPGQPRYVDVNNDGVIDANDRVVLGSNQPDFVWGMGNTFRYGNFDLGFQFQGVAGMDVVDQNFSRSYRYHEGRNYNRQLLNRWRSESEPGDGYTPKLSVDLFDFQASPSSYFIQDGSYIRLQNITFGYNLPSSLMNRIGFANARVYLSGENLLMITKYTGYDPENYQYDATDVARRGISHSAYPSAKAYSFGINFGL